MNDDDDLTDIGATPRNQDDLSDIGGVPHNQLWNKIKSVTSNFVPDISDQPSLYATTGLLSQFLPRDQKQFMQNIPQMLSGQKPGFADEISKGVGQYAPLMITGLPGIPGIEGMVARPLMTGAYEAASHPEDRLRGFGKGLFAGTIGEMPQATFSGLGYIAEKLNPQQYTNMLVNTIKNTYGTLKNKASDIYDNLRNVYGDSNVYANQFGYESKRALNPDDTIMEYINKNPTIRKMYNKFLGDQTYGNLQDLQSQIGFFTRGLSKSDPESYNTVEALNDFRHNYLMEDMADFLKVNTKKGYDDYQTARGITRDVLAPHENNDTILKIAEGRKDNISPGELSHALNQISETKKFPDNHYLLDMQDALNKKIKFGNTINNIGSLIGGIGLGQHFMPNTYQGAVGGLTSGALASKFVNPIAIELAQNPQLTNVLKKIKWPLTAAKGAYISAESDS